jgi:hypothetical protein
MAKGKKDRHQNGKTYEKGQTITWLNEKRTEMKYDN